MKLGSFITLIMLFVIKTSFSQGSDCEFKIQDGVYSIKPNTYAARLVDENYRIGWKGNKQKEISNNGKTTIIYRIEWISCDEYRITIVKQKNISKDWTGKIGDSFVFKVLSCDEMGFKVRYLGGDGLLEMEFIKI
jgi:hypothetical protein